MQPSSLRNDRIVSIHIEKTAGTSLLDFFCKVYGPQNVFFYHPKIGFLRQDKDPARLRRSYLGDWLKSILLQCPSLYKLMRGTIHKRERQTIDFTIPSTFSVIHGHFSPDDFSVNAASYVTVFRDPLQRTRSHFDDMKKWRGVVSNSCADLSFEEFALHESMVNFQTKRIRGKDLCSFCHFGITEDFDRYCRNFDRSGCIGLRRFNQSKKPNKISVSPSFLRRFEIAHREDIQLYQRAKQLS